MTTATIKTNAKTKKFLNLSGNQQVWIRLYENSEYAGEMTCTTKEAFQWVASNESKKAYCIMRCAETEKYVGRFSKLLQEVCWGL